MLSSFNAHPQQTNKKQNQAGLEDGASFHEQGVLPHAGHPSPRLDGATGGGRRWSRVTRGDLTSHAFSQPQVQVQYHWQLAVSHCGSVYTRETGFVHQRAGC